MSYGDPQLQLSLKVGAMDTGLIGTQDVRQYSGYAVVAETVKDLQDVLPTTQAPTMWQFNTVKNCDRYERWWLIYTIAMLNVVGGTYKRCCDGFGFFNINRVELKNGANVVQTIYPNVETYQRWMASMNIESREKLFPQAGLGFTAAQRNSRATGSQTFCIPLDFFWRDDPTKDPVVPAIANNLTITVYLNDPTTVIQTDGTAPVAPATIITYSNIAIRTEMIHTTEPLRAYSVARVTSGSQISYLYDEIQQLLPVFIPAGTTLMNNIKLDGLNGPAKHMLLLFRRASDVTTAYQYDWTNLSPSYNPDGVAIRTNNTDLLRLQDMKNFYDGVQKARYYSGLPWAGQLLPFSEDPESLTAVTGFVNLSVASSPLLVLSWNTATAVDMYCYVYMFNYNWVQHSDGNFRRVFSP